MKQSTKLLSLVLALVMAFSFVGVIGNAALVKGDITYDAIDDAQLTVCHLGLILLVCFGKFNEFSLYFFFR